MIYREMFEDPKSMYPIVAFLLTLIVHAVYIKWVVDRKCEGKEPRSWLDAFLLSLPFGIGGAAIVYYFTSQWAPKRQNNIGNMGGNNRPNAMGRMNGAAFGNNVRALPSTA